MSFYSESVSSQRSSYGVDTDPSHSEGEEDQDRSILEDSSLGTPNSSPGSAPSFGDSFNSRGDSNRGRERDDTSESDLCAKVSDFEAEVSDGSSVDNVSIADTSTVAGSSMMVSSDESETETEVEEQTSTEGEEEDEDDLETLSGIESHSQSTLQSSEDVPSSPAPVGLKQPATFLTQVLGDYQQRMSHGVPTKGGAIGQSRPPEEKDKDTNDTMAAVKSGDINLLKQLLKRRRHQNITDSNRRTLLHIACSLGRLEMVQLFIEMGMDVDACSMAGQTPLHEACIGGHYRILQRLLSEVSDLDAVDSNGLSAAHYCALNGEVKCLNLLCDQGCDICLEDEQGRTGVHLAALHDHADVIVCLMERGIELDLPDKQGKTPAHYAARHGSLTSLTVLVKNAVDITTGDESGLQPVHETASHNRLDCLKFLIKKGAKSTPVDNQKRNTVHMAAHYGALDCLHWLLENQGANPNLPDSQGYTGLHHAASGGHAECFHCLLSHGAEPSISSLSGDNALDVARKRGKPWVISKAIDGSKCCSKCAEKAAKKKLEEMHGKPSPIHNRLQHNKGSLFLHPISATRGQQDRNAVGSPRRLYKSKTPGSKPQSSALPKRNLAAKYYGPVL